MWRVLEVETIDIPRENPNKSNDDNMNREIDDISWLCVVRVYISHISKHDN